MRIIGLAGWSGSGKTTLVTKVIPVLVRRGLKVATVKHAHHDSIPTSRARNPGCIARPGPAKSPWCRAGAGPSSTNLAMRPSRHSIDMLAKLSPVDLVIVEGFKRHPHPKLEVYRAAVGKPLLHPDDDCIVAVATDAPLPQAQVPVVMLDDIEALPMSCRRRRCRASRSAKPPPKFAKSCAGAPIMAQLTDDCFALTDRCCRSPRWSG